MTKRREEAKRTSASEQGRSRRPGRPQAAEGGDVSRAAILKMALKMTKITPLQDLSIVSVAKCMKVTPALIHYYLGGRDSLTSGVMNLFYKDLLKKWPRDTGLWQLDLIKVATVIFGQFRVYNGVAAYYASHSRFRVFQLAEEGERDCGIEMLERFVGQVRAAGLSGERTGIYAHLFLEFIINTAYGGSRNIFPSSHRAFIEEKQSSLDPEKFPNIMFVEGSPVKIDATIAFEETCHLFLLSISSELSGQRPKFMLPSVARGGDVAARG